ncbi:MAG: ABC transporter permease [Rhizobiaceae bacterium]|jgi:peptide/nickel transport system permease protein|nr:ABC transporter permease [Rhizobiaceae bacterium]
MAVWLASRLAMTAATVLVASLVVFGVMEVLPGDPARLMLGMNATQDAVAALRTQMGLDLPLPVRYWTWITGFLTGDLGRSYTYGVPVAELVAERLAVSLPLALMALALSTLIALPVGLFAASRHGKTGDVAMMGLAQIGVAVPNFWFAIILVWLLVLLPFQAQAWVAQGGLWGALATVLSPVFAFFQWLKLPAGGFPGWEAGSVAALKALILPAIALALPQAAILSRVTRSALLEVLGEDYIRTARAKGLPRNLVIRRHALRNALIPVITILGLQFSFLIAGTIIIENVFYLPGLGRLVFQAITQRDLIVVQSVTMLLVMGVIVVNLLTDVLYAIADPRLRRAA